MMPRLVAVGLSHHTAPIAVRERLAPSPEEVPALLARLRDQAPESAIVLTCNRVEIYATLPDGADAGGLFSALAESRGVDPTAIDHHLVILEGRDAARHLFQVAAGLDSMVLGEAEVLGQVARAQRRARETGPLGSRLEHLFTEAIRVGRRARAETGISRHSLSVSGVAVHLALATFRALHQRSVLVLGAGEAARLACRALKGAGAGELMVVNRTLAHAQSLAEESGGRAIPFEGLGEALARADIVIAASGGTAFLVGPDLLLPAVLGRCESPLLILDVGVPRNIDPAVREVPGVLLYDIDDLEDACAAARRARSQEIGKVEAIVDNEVTRFMAWWEEQEITPVISTLYQEAEALRQREMRKALRHLKTLSPAERRHLEEFSRSLVTKLLHDPVVALKNEATDPRVRQVATRLFHPSR